MPKLFISHASEDKDAFVRPLAVALRQHFEVWFDEFELKLGDSLRSKIDHGLRTSDFGVVVLSPAFFSKKWTVSEVNGLFALEDENRKIILPVWYQVAAKEVAEFSPMLADRLAVDASKGLDRVVREIKIAVGVSERTHEVLVPDAARRALAQMNNEIIGWELDETILRSGNGHNLLSASRQRIEEWVWNHLASSNTPEKNRFSRESRAAYFVVNGPFWVSLAIFNKDSYVNTVRGARLVANIFLRVSDFEERREPTDLQELSWPVTCVSQQKLGYRNTHNTAVLTEEAVAEDIVVHVSNHIINRVKARQSEQA